MALSVGNANPGTLSGVSRPNPAPTIAGVVNAKPPLLTNLQSPKAQESKYNGPAGAPTPAAADSNIDPTSAAYYGTVADRLKSVLGTLPATEQQGRTKVEDNYRLGASNLNQGFSNTLRDIGIKRDQAVADKTKTLAGIDSNVSNTVDSFKRLLALGHAGNSAFAHDFVPTATARVGSQQRGQAFDTFGTNARALDISQGDAQQQHDNGIADLGRQKNDALYGLESGVEQNRQSLIDQLSMALYQQQLASGGGAAGVKTALAPFSDQVNSSLAKLQQLFEQYRNPTLSVAPVNVQTPNLATYTADPLVANLSGANPNTPQQDLPYLLNLRKRAQDAAAA